MPLKVVHTIMERSDRRNAYQYKLRESKFDEMKKLGSLLIGEQRDIFKKAYGSLLGVLLIKIDPGLILTFAQFYDPTLHCFTFQDFLLAPTLGEFAHIICIIARDQVPYMGTDDFPEVVVIYQALYLKKDVIESNLCVKGNVRGFPSKSLFEKAILFASSGS